MVISGNAVAAELSGGTNKRKGRLSVPANPMRLSRSFALPIRQSWSFALPGKSFLNFAF
jgi:hypothetical protein